MAFVGCHKWHIVKCIKSRKWELRHTKDANDEMIRDTLQEEKQNNRNYYEKKHCVKSKDKQHMLEKKSAH